ncbi:hypothetical protein [Dialister hominis]
MLPQKFFDVLKHEGVVSLTTWGRDVPHVTNTWNWGCGYFLGPFW